MSLNRLFVITATLVLFAQPALATVIVGATSASTTFTALAGFGNLGTTFDESGLAPKPDYVSGETLFSTLTPESPTHVAPMTDNAFAGQGTSGDFLFALDVTESGDPYTLTDFVFWTGASASSFAISAFELFVGAAADQLDSVGSWNPDNVEPQKGEFFSFDETPGAFVLLRVTGGHGTNIALGEVAFGGLASTSVPEPASVGLLILALLGLGFRRALAGLRD